MKPRQVIPNAVTQGEMLRHPEVSLRRKTTFGKKPGLIFVISGPSGSGKTTLLKNLMRDETLKNRVVRSISFTTRPKRLGEKGGRDYFFISDQQLEQKKKRKKILESTRYLGYYYATPKDFFQKQLKKGKHIIACLDLNGARKIRRLYPKKTVTIFIMPPSQEALLFGIKKRCHKTKREEVRQRLTLARSELLASDKYDYSLVNRDLAQTVRKLKGIILRKIIYSNQRYNTCLTCP